MLSEKNKLKILSKDKKNVLSYNKLSKHFLNDHIKDEHNNLKTTAADYHKKVKILVIGFSNGSFLIFETVGISLIHSLKLVVNHLFHPPPYKIYFIKYICFSISDTSISTIVLNNAGDWIALGCEGHGQLLVWEWQSETYVMKQQAHGSEISCLTYSADSVYIATGGEDGKVCNF
jgi:periodic tryptophan protein 2